MAFNKSKLKKPEDVILNTGDNLREILDNEYEENALEISKLKNVLLEKEDLGYADFSDGEFTNIYINSCNTTGIHFDGSDVTDSKFFNFDFEQADFEDCEFNECEFENGIFTGTKTTFKNTKIKKSTLKEVIFKDNDEEIRYNGLVSCKFDSCEFNVEFYSSSFSDSIFNKCSFSDKTFEKVNFNGVTFVDCDFTSMTFVNCSFDGAKFEMCEFRDTYFEDCDLDNIVKKNLKFSGFKKFEEMIR